MAAGYRIVTEMPGEMAWREQMERLFHRYRFALGFCEGRRVLEVGCGAGIGLPYLSTVAKKVIGGDIDWDVLAVAKEHHRGRKGIDLGILDAERLPFVNASFDVVLLFEAIYYLPRPAAFVKEARRVLRGGGVLMLCTVNKDWGDFNPSPLSTRYFSVPELCALLETEFQSVEVHGAFPAMAGSPRERLISALKRSAISLGVVPRTMKGKAFLKRCFFGRLEPIPPEIHEDPGEYVPPRPIERGRGSSEYKIIYALARAPREDARMCEVADGSHSVEKEKSAALIRTEG